jgi:hypothetical protein
MEAQRVVQEAKSKQPLAIARHPFDYLKSRKETKIFEHDMKAQVREPLDKAMDACIVCS